MKKLFEQYSAVSALGAGAVGFLYAVSFVVLKDATLSALFLMLSGLLALPVMVALYSMVKEVDEHFALIALILGVAGAFGYLVHGGYDLANVINPPSMSAMDLPSQVDPRGLLVFGVSGLAILKFSWLAQTSKVFPNSWSTLGLLSGLLLLVIYLARLIVLSPASPTLLYPVLLEGFVVNPIWYLWLGSIFLGKKS